MTQKQNEIIEAYFLSGLYVTIDSLTDLCKKVMVVEKKAITRNEYRNLPMDFPRNWEPLIYFDATPDKDYVLRLLRAHLENCIEGVWGGTNQELVNTMNELQGQRKRLLDDAIFILERSKIRKEIENGKKD